MKRLFAFAPIAVCAWLLAAGAQGADDQDNPYPTDQTYRRLRMAALQAKPEKLGVDKNADILGVIVETGYPNAAVTLAAMIDGSISLYFSNGGGIIGLGRYEKPGIKAARLLKESEVYMAAMEKTAEFPLPRPGRVRFYIVTPDAVYTGDAPEKELAGDQHNLSSLFFAAQELLTEIRKIDEQNRKKPR